jgi:hypothetical protein
MTLSEPALFDLAAVIFRRKMLEENGVTALSPDCLKGCMTTLHGFITPERAIGSMKKVGDIMLGLHEFMGIDAEFLNSIN